MCLAVLLLLACQAAEPDPNPTFLLGTESQWAGGTVTISSTFFSGQAALPVVLAGDSTVAAVRLSDTSVAITLPRIPSQDVDIVVVDGNQHYPVGTVTLAGYRQRKNISPGYHFEPYVLPLGPSPNGPMVVGGAATPPAAGGITLINLRSGQARIVSGVEPPDAHYGVGITFRPGQVILRDSTGGVSEWHLLPSLSPADSIPSVTITRQIARLSDSVWMNTNGNTTRIIRGGTQVSEVFMEDPWRINLSPAVDRAVMNGSENDGVPVFAMTTGDTVFRLPAVVIAGVAFDTVHQVMYALGGNGAPSAWRVMAIDPANGALIDESVLPGQINPAGMALNQTASLIFVPSLEPDCFRTACVPEILVVEASTLQLLGRLRARAADSCPSNCNGLVDALVTVDDQTGTIFLISHGEPSLLWEFDLLPSN